MSNRNRTAGNNWEKDIAQRFNRLTLNNFKVSGDELRKIKDAEFKVFPKLGTTRELSRALDAKKVDITSIVKERESEFPYLIQAKSLVSASVPYPKFLDEIRQNNTHGIPVFLHKQTMKQGSKFVGKDEFACLYMKDFLDIIFELRKLQILCKNQQQDTTDNS